MKLYHGSTHKFEKFDFSKIGENATDQGKGFYFTDNITLANAYTKDGGYMYTVEFKGKKALSSTKKAITRSKLKKLIMAIEEETQFLSNYGDVEYEGFNNVMNAALESEYDYNNNDVDIINALINGSGNIQEVLTKTYEVLGYDHIVEEGLFSHLGESKVYVALVEDCFKVIKIEEI